MNVIKELRRDGTCEEGWMRQGDLCVKKGADKAEIEKETREFHKSLRAPRKPVETEICKRTGVPLIKRR